MKKFCGGLAVIFAAVFCAISLAGCSGGNAAGIPNGNFAVCDEDGNFYLTEDIASISDGNYFDTRVIFKIKDAKIEIKNQTLFASKFVYVDESNHNYQNGKVQAGSAAFSFTCSNGMGLPYSGNRNFDLDYENNLVKIRKVKDFGGEDAAQYPWVYFKKV
jgi:hypothetical protein